MDSYKKLKLEFNGISDTIQHYTDDANIVNYLSILNQALSTNDIEAVLYCIDEICTWYDNNLYKIKNNTYVYNLDDHIKNKKILNEIREDFETYDFSHFQNQSEKFVDTYVQKKSDFPKIFLSHCSANKKFTDALEKLIVGLGVENTQLIYTTHPLHKIPLDKNIYEYLRDNINQNVFVIILWSNEYLESPACLNEMGAAWVTQTDYTNIYTPDFAFGNPKYHQCAVDTRKMGAVLNGDDNCKASMIEFKNKIIEMFDLTVDEQKSSYLLDQFMKDIK